MLPTLPTRSRSLLHAALRPKPYICQSCLRSLHQSPRARPIALQPAARHLHAAARLHNDVVPFRKQLKDEERRKKAEAGSKKAKKNKNNEAADPLLEKWELTVGIEIHAELNTARKLFSTAATSTADPPNTHVAPFDVAFPGTQPHFQPETLIPALRAALALGCHIQPKSSFDRKHYFYQDQPQGYQITQYYEPFARDGHITLHAHDGIDARDGASVTIGIKQVQMEQDTAKTTAQPPAKTHLLDFNRVSHPLVEIITLPHMHHARTAAACVRKIQHVLKNVGAVTAGMEVGGLRADVNVSVRQRRAGEPGGGEPGGGEYGGGEYGGVKGLGQRTEIKNLSSLKAVEEAIVAERDRQIAVLEAGGVVEGETRGWTLGSKETRKLRGKEGEVDYRYMPDPDLGPVVVGEDLVRHLRETLPALPDEVVDMLMGDPRYGLSVKDAKTLVGLDAGDRLDYYLDVVEKLNQQMTAEERVSFKAGKAAGNWVLMELGGLMTSADVDWSDDIVPAEQLASIILHSLRGQITGPTAKQLLSKVFYGDERPVERIVEEEKLLLVPMTREEYLSLVQEVLNDNPDTITAIKEKGQTGKLMFLVGQTVRRGDDGRVEAKKVEEVLRELLEIPA
ncbi:mitochondrial cytochrome c oxidase assembly factor [Diplodia corticola]|uniref:Glutamyl-tRNA(Gln) amidotransferase subunit B, mitochondrial n=1 Tax=Diplodia corticola TaxID=236234 RepID=A0A1J9QQ07_9PEZI|nr:mitochondrial cytochrome c oxidase assembly factor [Diplodia corticola]OJD30537.1 mitochondrial cytochrome c oxidase assembly factor [Diplodia corticola]